MSKTKQETIQQLTDLNQKELVQFLKDNLKIRTWCNRDRYFEPQINASISLGDYEISRDSDYLLHVD